MITNPASLRHLVNISTVRRVRASIANPRDLQLNRKMLIETNKHNNAHVIPK